MLECVNAHICIRARTDFLESVLTEILQTLSVRISAGGEKQLCGNVI